MCAIILSTLGVTNGEKIDRARAPCRRRRRFVSLIVAVIVPKQKNFTPRIQSVREFLGAAKEQIGIADEKIGE